LNRVQSYQEFWHSWSTFHPNTTKYENNANQDMKTRSRDKKGNLVTALF
jgi:hypothetical protein